MTNRLASLLVVSLLARGVAAHATTIDGQRDPEYGPALSTQTTQTSLGDTPPGYNPFSPLTMAIGSELDGAHGFVSGSTLRLFFSGNLRSYVGEPLIAPDQLQIYVDCAPGGQNTLRADNPSVGPYLRLDQMAGLTFDSGFAPDYWLACEVDGSGPSQPFFAYYAELPTTGGGSGGTLGHADGGGTGTLTGGTNPFGIMASIDQTNRAGVDGGCGAAGGSGVTTGVEWAVPLAALGNPTGEIRVCALIARAGQPVQVSNQVLGPVPPGSCSLGAPVGIDFTSIPGLQYFSLGLPAAAPAPLAARLVLHEVAWGPGREGTVTFSLPRPGTAVLEVFDPAGRRIARRVADGLTAGPHVSRIVAAVPPASGVYFLGLRGNGEGVSRSFVIAR